VQDAGILHDGPAGKGDKKFFGEFQAVSEE
jgi:hypothetical protein